MPILSINNQPVEVNEEVTLLGAIEKTGVKVPTLCHHKALTPYGSCRLCVVEIHRPDRAPFLQASCSYPALDGVSVFTDTDRVKRARKIAAELLLARCPDSAAIQRIAYEYGVVEPRIKKKFDDCIYCGLCVRMCQERMGRSAIGFTGRGPRKKLESPFRKHNKMCWTCGACDFICPVGKKVTDLTTGKDFIPLPNTHNIGLDRRPAAYVLYPQAVPNKATLDPQACIRLNHDACGICEVLCEAKAIDFRQKDRTIEIEAGAIILSPGFEVFDATLKEGLGYGRYPNVINSIQLERILSPSGPYSGSVLRPSDHSHPKRLAFLQCVGSREVDRDYCSSVCCMYATKQAIIAKEHAGSDLQCDIYFMDIRAFSKGFELYYESAKKKGVRYIRCRVPQVEEIPGTQNLMVKYLGEGDQRMQQEYELVILSVGLEPPKDVQGIARTFGIELNEFKFFRTSIAQPAESTRPGVFVAGLFTGPKDI
ncbi:MAG: 2Fe-2S iron-sulfur cluster-binding protein, partial [Acidobacteriota bacterium]